MMSIHGVLRTIIILAVTYGALYPIAVDAYGDKAGLFSTEYGMSARNISLGRAFTGVGDDYTALYFNPGSIGLGGRVEGGITYGIAGAVLSSRYVAGAFVFPFNDFVSSAVSIANFGSADSITGFDAFGLPTGETYSDGQNAVLLGTSLRAFSDKRFGSLYAGANVKFVTFSLARDYAFGFGFDAGLLWDMPLIKSRFGLSVQNVPPPVITIDDVTSSYPLNVRFGASTRVIDPSLLITLEGTLIGLTHNEPAFNVLGGVEWTPIQYVSIAAGANTKEITAGATFRLMNIAIGYALSLTPWISPIIHNHFFTVSAVAGMTADKKEKALTAREGDVLYKEFEVRYQRALANEDFKSARDAVTAMIANREQYAGAADERLKISLNDLTLKIDAEELVTRAKDLYAAGKYDAAFESIQSAYKKNPEYKRGMKLRDAIYNHKEVAERITLITIQMNEKKYEEANNGIEYCLKLEPDNRDLQALNRQVKPFIAQKLSAQLTEDAAMFLKIGRHQNALDKADEALKQWPGNYDAKNLKVRIVNDMLEQKYASAFDAYKKGQYGDALPMLEDIERAKNEGKDYNELLARTKKLRDLINAKKYLALAKEALEKNDFKAVEANIKKALEYDPSDPETLETYERYKSMKSLLQK